MNAPNPRHAETLPPPVRQGFDWRAHAVRSDEKEHLLVCQIPGEPLRYYVESRTSPDRPHTVDMSLHGGRGACSCKGWITSRWPFIRDGALIGLKKAMCAHVRAARDISANQYHSNSAAILHPTQP